MPDSRKKSSFLSLSAGYRLGLALPSTMLHDFSRYILAWMLCSTMTATDVSDTLTIALRSSRLERVLVPATFSFTLSFYYLYNTQ